MSWLSGFFLGSILLISFSKRATGLLLCVAIWWCDSTVSIPFVCQVYPSSMNVYALPSSVSIWTQQLYWFVVLRVKVNGKLRWGEERVYVALWTLLILFFNKCHMIDRICKHDSSYSMSQYIWVLLKIKLGMLCASAIFFCQGMRSN